MKLTVSSRSYTKANRSTSKCRKKTTVGSLDLSSLSRIVSPEKRAITKDVMSATRVQYRIIREISDGESNWKSRSE